MGINEGRANMSKLERRKSAFVRCNSLSNNQGTRDDRVNYPGYVSIGNGNYQNKQWRNDKTGSSFSPPEARYSIFANNTNFPQNYTPQASKFALNSQVFEGSSNGKMAKDLDLNFVNQNNRNLGKQNRVFGTESLGKSSDVQFGNENYSNFANKYRDLSVGSHRKSSELNIVNEKYSYFEKKRDVGVDSLRQSSGLNFVNATFEKNKYFGVDTHQKSSALDLFSLRNLKAKVSGSINLNSNPAMQLPGLMDAGKRSNSLLDSDGKLKITSKKPLSSSEYPPEVLDKPHLFITDHGPKQLFGRDIGVPTNGSRPIYISDSHSEEPSGRGFRLLFSSKASSSKVLDNKPMLISDDHSKEPFGRDIGVSNNILQSSSSTLFGKTQWRENDNFPAFWPYSSSFPSKSNSEEGNGVPTQVTSKSEEKKKGESKNIALQIIESSDSVPNGQRGQENTSREEVCDVNRNPADFSFDEPTNEFTISGRDLNFNQMMSLKGKQGSGTKKQKVAVPTVPKQQ